MTETALLQFADDLERLARGELPPEDLRERYRWDSEAPEVILHIMCYVDHYLSDEDIRAKDDAYREMQDSEMSKLIELIRAGAPRERLVKIHFLGRTAD